MELIDGVFHQLSKDIALVAITADYPGLILTPQVPEIEVQAPQPSRREGVQRGSAEKNGEVFEAEGRTCGNKPTRGRRAPWVEKRCNPDRGVSAKVWRAPLSQVLYLRSILTLVLFSGQRDAAGLYPEKLPIAPPPARLQSLVRRRRRTQGARQTLLRRRMCTGCLPPTLRWRVP